MMVGRLLSFWDGTFSGAMLNFQGVSGSSFSSVVLILPRPGGERTATYSGGFHITEMIRPELNLCIGPLLSRMRG